LILNQTVFYAESGGQIGDVGEISNTNSFFEVMNTQKIFGDLFVHFGKLSKGSLKVEDNLSLIINKQRREKIKAYHSATHLLHAALREKLGKACFPKRLLCWAR
jgi:Alanyl-tRNA synthetase